MKGISIVFVFASVSLFAQSRPDGLTNFINQEAEKFLSSPNAVGVSIGVYKDGKKYFFNYGSKIKGQRLPPSAETPYCIASLSKTFAGLLLAYAVTENKVTLNDDVRLYLEGAYPNLEYNGDPIRLVHLSSHVSRIPYSLSADGGSPVDTKAAFLEALHHVRLDTLPGIRFKYSNAGVQLLQFILEKVYNTSYDDLLHEKITGPLHMSTSAIHLTTAHKKRMPLAYNEKGEPDSSTHENMGAAGGMKSSVADLLNYLAFQINEADTAVQLSHQEVWGFPVGEGKRYSCALNWQMETLGDGTRKIFQDGNLPNYSVYIGFSPESMTGVVVLSNAFTMDATNQLASSILKKIRREE